MRGAEFPRGAPTKDVELGGSTSTIPRGLIARSSPEVAAAAAGVGVTRG